jgi:ankyrin repeat protein
MKLTKFAATLIALSTTVACAASSTKKAEPKPKAPVNGDVMVEAITSGKMDQVKRLMAQGISIDSISSDDQTGLMKLADDGDQATVNQLLKLGANIDQANSSGETAVWFAVYAGHEQLALSLLSKGAKVNQVKKDSNECLIHYAAKAQLVKLSTRLKSKQPKCLSQKNSDGLTPAEIAKSFGDVKLATLLAPPKTAK